LDTLYSYKIVPNINGWTVKSFTKLGVTLGSFGAVAGIAVLFIMEGIPRVRRDILQQVPVMGDYWVREIPASDNVRILSRVLEWRREVVEYPSWDVR
jgi:ubiquinol-cytochrome c reductase subunit 10